MEPSAEYPVRRFQDGQFRSIPDPVVTETRIELDVNDGQLRLAMLTLASDLEAMAVGFLVGEGALRDVDDLDTVEYCPDEGRITVRGQFDADVLENITLRWTLGTGCGGGGTSRDMDSPPYAPVKPGPMITAPRLIELAGEWAGQSDLWRKTGGVHACALCDEGGIILSAQDIGRHNAFDKVVGMAVMEKIDLTDKIVLSTGRLAGEIVSKAVACGLPILASRSAVTSMALKLARRFGVTLVGFMRGGRLNVYTGYERITAGQDSPEQ